MTGGLGWLDRLVRVIVLFDLFGVIARVQSPAGLAGVEAVAGVTDRKVTDRERFWTVYWQCRPDYDAGSVDAAGYWAEVGRQLGRHYSPEHAARLLAADMASWEAIDTDMVAYLHQLLDAGHTLALLSNIPRELADHMSRQPWMSVFSVVGFSCRIGAIKPNPAAFRWCLDQLGVAADQVFFVDDSPANVEGARAVGLRGHVFTDLPTLKAELSDLGGPLV